jgi:hypothetical protein
MVAGLTAQAADTTLTLACQGTVTDEVKDTAPEPVSLGIIVNFTKQTVQGIGYSGEYTNVFHPSYPVEITNANEVTISFGGSYRGVPGSAEDSVEGVINRVTGDANAHWALLDLKTSKYIRLLRYALKCRPAQRMF